MVLILTDPAVGGTFLTWSLHYLAGHTKYFHSRSNSWVELINDPVTDINAHKFQPTQPVTISEVRDFLQKMLSVDPVGFHSFYFHNLHDQHDYTSSRHQLTVDVVNDILPKFSKVIIVNNTHPLYNISFNSRTLTRKFCNPQKSNKTFEEQHNDFIEYFFKNSLDEWKEQNLTNLWDHREFLALNLRPYQQIDMISNANLNQPHYLLNTFELYNILDETIIQLFNFLEIKIDTDRISHWKEVYNKWKKIHLKRLKFVWYFDTIVDYIVNGYNLDLLNFDLDLLQEATIQHSLIYKHNLNLKTFQLEKFTNTKQLHDLLESNIHILNNY